MKTYKYIHDPYLKDDIDTGRKGNKKAGRKNRKKYFRALRKRIKIIFDKIMYD